jgi:hypothetical protein
MVEAMQIIHMVKGSFDLWTKIWRYSPDSFGLFQDHKYHNNPTGWHSKIMEPARPHPIVWI